MPQLEHKWEQERDTPFTCLGCGKPNMASRGDAKCCNATCRQRYRRKLLALPVKPDGKAKTGCMQVPNFPDVKRDRSSTTRNGSVARSAGKPRKKPTRSTTRCTPKKKGAKKR